MKLQKIGPGQLREDAVSTNQIQDGSVDGTKIKKDAVETKHIKDKAVDESKLSISVKERLLPPPDKQTDVKSAITNTKFAPNKDNTFVTKKELSGNFSYWTTPFEGTPNFNGCQEGSVALDKANGVLYYLDQNNTAKKIQTKSSESKQNIYNYNVLSENSSALKISIGRLNSGECKMIYHRELFDKDMVRKIHLYSYDVPKNSQFQTMIRNQKIATSFDPTVYRQNYDYNDVFSNIQYISSDSMSFSFFNNGITKKLIGMYSYDSEITFVENPSQDETVIGINKQNDDLELFSPSPIYIQNNSVVSISSFSNKLVQSINAVSDSACAISDGNGSYFVFDTGDAQQSISGYFYHADGNYKRKIVFNTGAGSTLWQRSSISSIDVVICKTTGVLMNRIVLVCSTVEGGFFVLVSNVLDKYAKSNANIILTMDCYCNFDNYIDPSMFVKKVNAYKLSDSAGLSAAIFVLDTNASDCVFVSFDDMSDGNDGVQLTYSYSPGRYPCTKRYSTAIDGYLYNVRKVYDGGAVKYMIDVASFATNIHCSKPLDIPVVGDNDIALASFAKRYAAAVAGGTSQSLFYVIQYADESVSVKRVSLSGGIVDIRASGCNDVFYTARTLDGQYVSNLISFVGDEGTSVDFDNIEDYVIFGKNTKFENCDSVVCAKNEYVSSKEFTYSLVKYNEYNSIYKLDKNVEFSSYGIDSSYNYDVEYCEFPDSDGYGYINRIGSSASNVIVGGNEYCIITGGYTATDMLSPTYQKSYGSVFILKRDVSESVFESEYVAVNVNGANRSFHSSFATYYDGKIYVYLFGGMSDSSSLYPSGITRLVYDPNANETQVKFSSETCTVANGIQAKSSSIHILKNTTGDFKFVLTTASGVYVCGLSQNSLGSFFGTDFDKVVLAVDRSLSLGSMNFNDGVVSTFCLKHGSNMISNYDTDYNGSILNPTSSVILLFGQSNDGSNTHNVTAVDCDPFNNKLASLEVNINSADIPQYRRNPFVSFIKKDNNNGLVAFTGGYLNGDYYNDLWKFDFYISSSILHGSWLRLSGVGKTLYPSVYSCGYASSMNSNKFVCFNFGGKQTDSVICNLVRSYDLTEPSLSEYMRGYSVPGKFMIYSHKMGLDGITDIQLDSLAGSYYSLNKSSSSADEDIETQVYPVIIFTDSAYSDDLFYVFVNEAWSSHSYDELQTVLEDGIGNFAACANTNINSECAVPSGYSQFMLILVATIRNTNTKIKINDVFVKINTDDSETNYVTTINGDKLNYCLINPTTSMIYNASGDVINNVYAIITKE